MEKSLGSHSVAGIINLLHKVAMRDLVAIPDDINLAKIQVHYNKFELWNVIFLNHLDRKG